MRYRTILETKEKLPRAVQAFHETMEAAEIWAKIILKGREKLFSDDVVRIWQTDERLVKNVYSKKETNEGKQA